jgi:hypothetical protein
MLLHRGRLVADGYREPGDVEPPPYSAATLSAAPPSEEPGPDSLAVDMRSVP